MVDGHAWQGAPDAGLSLEGASRDAVADGPENRLMRRGALVSRQARSDGRVARDHVTP